MHLYIHMYMYIHLYLYLYLYSFLSRYTHTRIHIYIYIYIDVYIFVCICVHIHMYTHIYAYLHPYIQDKVMMIHIHILKCIYMYIYVYMYICIHIYIYIYIHIYIYYIYKYTHIYICIQIYMHTQTHTQDNAMMATPDGDHYYKSIPAAMWPTLLNLSGEVPLSDFTVGGRVVCGACAGVYVYICCIYVRYMSYDALLIFLGKVSLSFHRWSPCCVRCVCWGGCIYGVYVNICWIPVMSCVTHDSTCSANCLFLISLSEVALCVVRVLGWMYVWGVCICVEYGVYVYVLNTCYVMWHIFLDF